MYEILNRFRLCFGEETWRAFWVLCYETSQPQNIHKVLPGSKTTRITHTVSENCGPRDDRLPRQFSIDSAFTFRWMIRTAYTRRRRRSIGHSSARYSANWLRFYVKFEWTWGHTSRSSAAEPTRPHDKHMAYFDIPRSLILCVLHISLSALDGDNNNINNGRELCHFASYTDVSIDG